ncbi:hypothetical protein [Pandoraea sputorum]|uniref:hypothetical protein n=1 Tax=Pandoraea sputorum TaxID=93222 RepID=UPI00355843F8
MPRFAIVEGGVVVNVVLWDGEAECNEIPFDAVELPLDSPIGPGCTFDGKEFSAPIVQVPQWPFAGAQPEAPETHTEVDG